jgi:MFS family permease
MSGDHGYPPPGPPPPPGWQPPPAPARAPWPLPQWAAPSGPPSFAPGMLGAAHKPGAMPLRPLGLGDIYDAGFRIIRFNPKATVGSAVLVTAAAMAIPIVVTAILTVLVDFTADTSGEITTAELIGVVGSFGSLTIGAILQSIGMVLVTGMIAHVTAAAAIGRRLTLGEAWAATRGSRWRLIGLTVLLALITLGLVVAYVVAWIPVALLLPTWAIVVFGIVSVPAFTVLMLWFWIRVYYLPVPALMLEPVGVTGAIGRGFRLTRGQFWRTFGIALLTVVIAQTAGSMLSLPATLLGPVLVGVLSPQYAVLGLVLTNAFTSVVAAAFVAPFTTAVASVQYLDQRMRKEAYDVELMSRAGITRS